MRRAAFALAAALALFGFPAAAAAATPAPAWGLTSLAAPTNFKPGDASNDYYQLEATNIGAEPTDGSPIVLSDTLPAGLTVTSVELRLRTAPGGGFGDFGASACKQTEAGGALTVTCTIDESIAGAFEPAQLWPGERVLMIVHVSTPPSASGTLVNQVSVQGGGAVSTAAQSQGEACDCTAPPGLSAFDSELIGPDGAPLSEAASYPFAFRASLAISTKLAPPSSEALVLGSGGDLRNVEVHLPAGLMGRLTAAPRCAAKQFVAVQLVSNEGGDHYVNECPDAAAVGTITVSQLEGIAPFTLGSGAVYNLVPPPGMPALFGFQIAGIPVYLETELRSGGDYGISARVRNTSQLKRVTAASLTLWGVPADPAHDHQRGFCAETEAGSCPSEGPERPLLRLPTSCASSLLTRMGIDTWLHPGLLYFASDLDPPPGGCDRPDFSPTIESRPTTNLADSPSGLRFSLRLPQAAHEDPEGLGEADLRDAGVTLPEGLFINPAAVSGLEACSAQQIGYLPGTSEPAEFTPTAPACPDASKIGRVEVDTPVLAHTLPGSVYLASQQDNPPGSLLAIYIVVEDPLSGVVVKLAAEVSPDPTSGQVAVSVTEAPQIPFSDFRLEFFAGPRAVLRTPPGCGAYSTTSALRPHTAPASGADATPFDSFTVSGGPAGACPDGALQASLSVGLQNPTAATYSPLALRLARPDGSGEFSALSALAPKGLLARLAGLSSCPEQTIAALAANSGPGSGAREQRKPSCPPSSRVGALTIGAGAGPTPFFGGGELYLAPPYKGAPLSFLAVIPAVGGPLDLGIVTNRIALHADPQSAELRAVSDPFPRFIGGVSFDVREIRVNLDRPRFTLAPSSCKEQAVSATVHGYGTAPLNLSRRFGLGGCAELPFKPKLTLGLHGGTERGAHPQLRTQIRLPSGSANLSALRISLPPSEFLDQASIRTICSRVQFAERSCPRGSVYGSAKVWSPLLDEPLRGPIYLRSSDRRFPDVVAALRGPPGMPVEVHAVGHVDSIGGRIRASFDSLPDAPIARVTARLEGGSHQGLLINSQSLCSHRQRAKVAFGAHNGKRVLRAPLLGHRGCGKRG